MSFANWEDHGCQTLSYELTTGGLQVTGKLLDKECASKVFRSSIREFARLKLELSGLSEQSDCKYWRRRWHLGC